MVRTRTVTPIAVKAAVAAEMLDCSKQHIYNLIERGELTRVSIGSSRSSRIPVADIYRIVNINPLTEGSIGGAS